MELALITMEKITGMFVILLAGVLAFKTGILDSPSNKHLSALLTKIISPCLLFMSYQIDFQTELFHGLIVTLLLSFASYVWSILIANLLFRKGSSANVEIERFSVVYSNCGFIGIPLINALIGAEGVFYMSAYITMYNLFVWSHGLAVICGSTSLKTTLRNFIQPSTVAIAVGIVCFLTQFRIPEAVGDALQSVGNMNTPVAMLVAGCNLAESDFLGTLKRRRSYFICFVKLLLVPLVSVLILRFVPANPVCVTTVVVAVSCPTGAMGTMLALLYDKNSNYASELFTITTVFSLVTIPLVILLMGMII